MLCVVVFAQEALIEDSERLKQQVLERDAQLAQYMSQLASHLSGLPVQFRSSLSYEQATQVCFGARHKQPSTVLFWIGE